MEYLGILIPGAVCLIGLVAAGLVMVRLFKRSTPENALVRTGAGGMKVVVGGGIFVVPGLHDLMRVSMKTMTITVDGGEGLITKDSRRVDAVAQFFIRVGAGPEAIMAAAQSLGNNTNDVGAIRTLLEGKVQDAMRSITAGMDLDELVRSRAVFVQQVQQALNKDLEPNGLNLESVALTKLDETPISRLDENNTFDVTGMRARAEIVSTQRKQRVAIEEEAELEISRTRQQNRVKNLEIEKIEATATEAQRIEIAQLTAATAQRNAEINAQTEQKEQEARITREQKVAEAEIERSKQVALAEQQSKIEIAQQSEAQSDAEAKASEARARAITAEEGVNTARLTEIANRDKNIAVLAAEQQAEQAATAIRVKARVEREAAEDQAAAVIAKARSEAEAITIRAEAISKEGVAEAEAIRAKVEAENALTPEIIAYKLQLAKIEAMPAIISAMVEPARHIQSLKVHQFTGMQGLSAGAGGGAAGSEDRGGGVVDEVFKGVRRNAVAMPVLKALGDQIGLDLAGGLDAMAASIDAPAIAVGGASTAGAPEADTAPADAAPGDLLSGPARKPGKRNGHAPA